jgi:hypothetical protein
MNKSTLNSGFKISMAMEDKKDGDFSYTLLKILMNVTSAQKLGLSGLASDKKIEAMFQQVTNKILTYIATSKNKIYMTMGDSGLDTLLSMTKADAHPEDLSKDPAFTAFSKIAGDDGQVLMRLSTNKVMSLITSIMGARTNAVDAFTMPEGSNTGVWASMKAEGNSLKSVGFWSAKEIAVIVQQAMTLYMSSMFSDTDISDVEMSQDELQGLEDFDME